MRTEPQRVVAGRSGSQRVVADLPDQPHATSNRRTSNIESSSKPQGDPRDVFAFSRCDDSGSPPTHAHTEKICRGTCSDCLLHSKAVYVCCFMLVLFYVLCGDYLCTSTKIAPQGRNWTPAISAEAHLYICAVADVVVAAQYELIPAQTLGLADKSFDIGN